MLHELTHRGQFEANAWVRPYFRSMVDELLDVMQMDPKTLLDRLGAALQPGEKKDADAGPLALRFLEPRQREVFDQVQAFMSVIEGHGNFVMDRIGEVHIPSQPRMSRALRSPENSLQTPMGKLIGKLLGLEFKKAQYVQGQHFFDTIYEQGGSRKGPLLPKPCPAWPRYARRSRGCSAWRRDHLPSWRRSYSAGDHNH